MVFFVVYFFHTAVLVRYLVILLNSTCHSVFCKFYNVSHLCRHNATGQVRNTPPLLFRRVLSGKSYFFIAALFIRYAAKRLASHIEKKKPLAYAVAVAAAPFAGILFL